MHHNFKCKFQPEYLKKKKKTIKITILTVNFYSLNMIFTRFWYSILSTITLFFKTKKIWNMKSKFDVDEFRLYCKLSISLMENSNSITFIHYFCVHVPTSSRAKNMDFQSFLIESMKRIVNIKSTWCSKVTNLNSSVLNCRSWLLTKDRKSKYYMVKFVGAQFWINCTDKRSIEGKKYLKKIMNFTKAK